MFFKPYPPRDLQIDVASGKLVHLDWSPPNVGRISGYKLTVVPLSDQDETGIKNLNIGASDDFPFTLRDLTPGGSYEIQLQSVFHEKPSNLFLSANFTTKPNTPGRFIVWFRNETTLLVLWQPPYPAGIFDQYKVSIEPKDAQKSVLYVEKESEPPGPAQAAFYGLVPGRAYNISVQTVSHTQISAPTEAQYRTVPLPPTNISFNRETVTTNSFDVNWLPPKSLSEFDRYQVSLGVRSSIPKVITKDSPRVAHFNENLAPGKTYEVVVKTVSGNVASWPVTGNVTTRPLPVLNLTATAGKTGEIKVQWQPNNNSVQDSYMVKYHDLEAFNADGSVQIVQDTHVHLDNLLDGRNYSIFVIAISKDVNSEENVVYQPTRPAPPVIGVLETISGKKLNVSWKSDVTSRQDSYQVMWTRNDTKEKHESVTKNNWLLLENLYPGAGYEIKVSAISFGLLSEPHSYHQAIPPLAPESLQVAKASNATLILTWTKPKDSLIDHYIIRYRPINSSFWREMGVVNTTSTEIRDLVAGERYAVRVSTFSNRVESVDIQEVEQTMYPNSIESVSHTIDSHNITFRLVTPAGRIDYYIIVYNSVREPTQQNSKQVPASNRTRVGEIVNAVIDGLTPGELYSFRFYAVSHNLRSEGIGVQTRTMLSSLRSEYNACFFIRAVPVISSVINIVTDEHETRTLGVKYTPTPRRNVVFDRYRFQLLSDPSIPAQEKLYNDTSRLVIFDNLIPGRLYNISIWTVSGGVYSSPIIREVRLYPEPVRSLSALKTRDTEIILMWEMPYGDKDGYEITYLDPQISNHLIRNKTFTEKISFTGLKPHQNYSFEVRTVSGIGTGTVLRSSPVSQTFTTLESTPGKVVSFYATDIKPNEITLHWSLPSADQNGVLTGFKISYFIKGNQVLKYQLFEPHDNQGTIYNLIPGKVYVFQIQAHTKVGPGHKATWEEQMPIWSPPSPAENVFATEVSHSSTTIRVRYRKNYFSNIYGPVIAYTVIVSEDPTQETSALDLPSWRDVRKKSVWPPYQATEPYYPFNGTLVEDFTIGNEECDTEHKKYCNGPLKPGATYKVKIRAFTTPEKFIDTVYSYSISTDPDNTALLLGISLPLSFLLMLAMVFIVLRYKRIKPFRRKKKVPKALHHINAKEDTMSITESELITTRPIKLKDFAEHYRIMSADSDFRFSEEFELLKHVGRDKPCTAADLPVNRPKNRFTNILPYDHSRVKLMPTDDEEGTDYINSNYIPGYNSPREFIVTQGPLHSTRDDFWRMTWEQNSRAIVMLTRCIEKGREKCDHYWPYDTQPVYYGDIQVTVLNESQYADWTISEFKVMRGDQSRIVRHFHFTTWPDFGVPEPPITLVKFVRAFRDRVLPDSNKPIIVHCSAGVGRSGTFIALDRILQHIQKYDIVDIFGIVHEMRKERVWMVQNEQQYICIHQCLMCVLDGKEHLLDSPRPEMHDNQGFEGT
ncbi:tyrosine-protein phosphatase 10D-like protein [Leptotrombidium deliense]|uniref:protein-tyrosine-phosphatase n=1 Tax=Leptotrombidium deliense TaxID=299467 RepID=A0A443SQB2_9ACAR|nr:tyrosine-protein phosphatase 10D-like protein [Leptotrombidium deliense]